MKPNSGGLKLNILDSRTKNQNAFNSKHPISQYSVLYTLHSNLKTLYSVLNTKYSVLFFLLFSACNISQAQDAKLKDNMSLSGYMKYMHTAILPPADSGTLITDNFLHNRLNYAWYVNDKFTFNASMRNRFFWGELVRYLPDVYGNLGDDPGFFDLSILWGNGESSALHTVFDRLNLTYQNGDWEVIAGRQRINWGTSMIWNPNDIFNSYSYFDFDYEERPGTDAIQVNYYTSATSALSLIYELADSVSGSTFAAKYQFNKNLYDFQFFSGYQKEFVLLGGGWAGDIKGAGFRGEGTYFVPTTSSTGSYQFVGTVDIDYTFNNGLYIQSSYLFNSEGLNGKTGDYAAFYLDRNLSVQTLSPAMHNLFFQASGSFTPILSGGLATMLNPKDQSWFISPNISWNIQENFDLLVAGQFFLGDTMTLYGEGGTYLFMRFKYSF
ncbi:MAG: hypothetical protein OCD76_10365 [Reichenbachiella sp.]